MTFCPHCGATVTATDEFCPNCGFNLKAARAQQAAQANTPQSKQPNPTGRPNTPPTQANQSASSQGNVPPQQPGTNGSGPVNPGPSSKVGRWVALGVVILVVILGAGYLMGRQTYAKAKQVDALIAKLNSNNPKTVASVLSSDATNLQINEQTVKPLQNYLQSDKQYINQLKSDLNAKDQSADGNFKLTSDHKAFLVFPEYKLSVKALYPTIKTNRDAEVTVNSEVVKATNGNNYKIGPLILGTYEINAKANVDNKPVTTTKKLFPLKNSNDIAVTLKAPKSETKSTDKDKDTKSTTTATTDTDTDTASSTSRVNRSANSDSSYNRTVQRYKDLISEYDNVGSYGHSFEVSTPAANMKEIDVYDKDTNDLEDKYRYDEIHDLISKYNEDTGKWDLLN
ncbi:hypothetical protein FC83_GL001704 [Agrilactobacillus composti DSM 18527 = JCM 14202]|uniref:Uncharacterized protein n=1 Tax=Agrilactobacillus composti DSM 18527 = JCM 14202 TaxID=1423734 RepID=X0PCJ3_9LACO|nr:zinc-ribbon domain-containing protein [Agrilactobacillus composti]KRM30569.1 hypothetical protein FC83_GL001704 [Agrilactobacillus composti DSM 18527 = JCM 14202]GAF38359.1 hypothetical protein JCM14202_162 [Agrilactobacillus composti DSM 18527 = JCM 14202]